MLEPDVQKLLDGICARYSVTSHGDNPYTLEALQNVLMLRPYFEVAIALIDAQVSSAYRSERVNGLVGGAKDSKHMQGLALDLVSKTLLNEEAFLRLARNAYSSLTTLGWVRKIIWEPTWVHIDWHEPPWMSDYCAPPELLRMQGGKYSTYPSNHLFDVTTTNRK